MRVPDPSDPAPDEGSRPGPELGPESILCPHCRRQADVRGIAAGERVRCACGAGLVVPARRAQVARPIRCGACGGAIEAGRRACAYCSAEVTLDELRLSAVCPRCSTRLASDARWCTHCGLAIDPQSVRALREGAVCPRCSGRLQARSAGPVEVVECASCAGLWLDPEVFERLCERAEEQEHVLGELRRELPGAPVAATSGRVYLACVTCGDFMVPRNFGGSSGVIVDVCRRHGIWLDHEELARALAFVRSGGLMRARERDVARLERRAERARDTRSAPEPLPIFEPAAPGAELELERALTWLGARVGRWLGR